MCRRELRAPRAAYRRRYVDVNIDRDAAARYGLNVADVHSVVTRGDRRRQSSVSRGGLQSAVAHQPCARRRDCARAPRQIRTLFSRTGRAISAGRQG